MQNKIKPGDLVIFNPYKKNFVAKQKVLIGREDQIAVVISSIPTDTYLISFEPSIQALVDISLIERVGTDSKRDIVGEWFESHTEA